jgi:hypothetical protein
VSDPVIFAYSVYTAGRRRKHFRQNAVTEVSLDDGWKKLVPGRASRATEEVLLTKKNCHCMLSTFPIPKNIILECFCK